MFFRMFFLIFRSSVLLFEFFFFFFSASTIHEHATFPLFCHIYIQFFHIFFACRYILHLIFFSFCLSDLCFLPSFSFFHPSDDTAIFFSRSIHNILSSSLSYFFRSSSATIFVITFIFFSAIIQHFFSSWCHTYFLTYTWCHMLFTHVAACRSHVVLPRYSRNFFLTFFSIRHRRLRQPPVPPARVGHVRVMPATAPAAPPCHHAFIWRHHSGARLRDRRHAYDTSCCCYRCCPSPSQFTAIYVHHIIFSRLRCPHQAQGMHIATHVHYTWFCLFSFHMPLPELLLPLHTI